MFSILAIVEMFLRQTMDTVLLVAYFYFQTIIFCFRLCDIITQFSYILISDILSYALTYIDEILDGGYRKTKQILQNLRKIRIIKDSLDFKKEREKVLYSSTIKIHINQRKEDLDQVNNNKNLNLEVMNNRNNISTIQDNITRMKQEISNFKDNFAEMKHGLSYIYGKKTMAKGFLKNEIKG